MGEGGRENEQERDMHENVQKLDKATKKKLYKICVDFLEILNNVNRGSQNFPAAC